MNVNLSNFNEALPLFEKAIAKADFVAIDCELTGLQPPGYQLAIQDDEAQRYEKIRQASNAYRVIQFGVCIFTTEKPVNSAEMELDDKPRIVAHPFNFYVFPRERGDLSRGGDFMVNSGSFAFLSSHNFDFNQLIAAGIPYWNYRQESDAIERANNNLQKADIAETPENAEFIKQTTETIDHWLQQSTERTLQIAAMNSYYRRIIYQIVRNKYNGFLIAKNNEQNVEVKRLTETERETISKNAGKAALIDVVNASEIIRLIAKARKPLVGHNCLLDLGHVMQHFWDDLPKSIEKWKYMLFELTSCIVDTKYLVHNHPELNTITNSALNHLMTSMGQPPFIEHCPDIVFADQFSRYSECSTLYHEAGYDAYCTGVCLIRMISYACRSKDNINLKFENTIANLLNEESIRSICNKIYLMRSDMSCMDFAGYDIPPEPIVAPVPIAFTFTGIPRILDTNTISEILSSLGLLFVEWKDNNQCRIIFKDPSVVKESYVQSLLDSNQKANMDGAIIFMEQEDTEVDLTQLQINSSEQMEIADTIGSYNPLKRPLTTNGSGNTTNANGSGYLGIDDNEPEEGEVDMESDTVNNKEATTLNENNINNESTDRVLPHKRRHIN
ncbi:CAF1 family ribonuclease-domain-containing protein [Syncephalis fuscata]|nr:CAF1 family ribonuclease-domain-containing protein [Syncephalis fuscata]